MSEPPKVVFVQPYLAKYRVPFYDALSVALGQRNLSLLVVAGAPSGTQAHRLDGAAGAWMKANKGWSVKFAGMTVGRVSEPGDLRQASAIVSGIAATSLDTYIALFRRNLLGGPPVGVWGHCKPYIQRGTRLDNWLRVFQMRCADHVFAYTESGREYAISRGIDPSRVTNVQNTIDTRSLARARSRLSTQEVESFVSSHRLHHGRVLGYIGALDAEKRVDLLAATLDRLWDLDDRIRVLVGGEGADAAALDSAIQRGQCIRLGYVDEHAKALIGATASALLNPGRVGLLAIDALTLGLPVVTTRAAAHAPEIGYLVEGESVHFAAPSGSSLASVAVALLDQDVMRVPGTEVPTIGEMASRFSIGIELLLNSCRRYDRGLRPCQQGNHN